MTALGVNALAIERGHASGVSIGLGNAAQFAALGAHHAHSEYLPGYWMGFAGLLECSIFRAARNASRSVRS